MVTTDSAPAPDNAKGGRLAQLGEGILQALSDLNGVLTSLRAFLADTEPKRRRPGRRCAPALTASLRAQRVRTARQVLGLSIGELAKMAGTTKDTVARYERGLVAVSKFERKILAALGLPEDDLTGDAEVFNGPTAPPPGTKPHADAGGGSSAAQQPAAHAKDRAKGLCTQDTADEEIEAEAAPPHVPLEALRQRAFAVAAEPSQASTKSERYVHRRSRTIRRYVLARANGTCEGCSAPAPFARADGTPYLEPHHLHQVSDDGLDHPAHVIAICPNCHKRVHHGADGEAYNAKLIASMATIEPHAS